MGEGPGGKGEGAGHCVQDTMYERRIKQFF